MFLVIFIAIKTTESVDQSDTAEAASKQMGSQPSVVINGYSSDTIVLFENQKIIFINGVKYSFSQIVDFTLNGDSYTTISSPIFKSITTKKADGITNVIWITVEDFNNPSIRFRTINDNTAQRVYSILKLIIAKKGKEA